MMRFKNPEAWEKSKGRCSWWENCRKKLHFIPTFATLFYGASFLGLSFTGLPQKFYTAPWAKAMIDFIGGSIVATKIHHISAVVMIAVFLSHIVVLCIYPCD